MEIGIIGTGDVGRALATGFTDADHDVVLGSRNPSGVTDTRVEVVTQAAAAHDGDVVVLAVPATAAVDIAESHREALAGTTVVDPTNEYPQSTADTTVAERVAGAAPDAGVVKAFNTIGANRLAAPVVGGAPVTMFIAGDDPDRCETVATLADDVGFSPLVAGDLPAAEHLEDLGRFWIDLSNAYGRDIGFELRDDDTQ